MASIPSLKHTFSEVPIAETDEISKVTQTAPEEQRSNENEPTDPLSAIITAENTRTFEKGYQFLTTLNLSHLRSMACSFKVVQTGATQNRIYVARIFLALVEKVGVGSSVHQLLSSDESWHYKSFLEEWTPPALRVDIPPFPELRKAAMLKVRKSSGSKATKSGSTSKPTGKKRKASSPKQKGVKKKKEQATTSEFARLLIIFQLYSEVRERFSKTLGKQDLDAGVKSKDFWEEDVATFFNDSDFKPKYSFGPALKGVDPSLPPKIKRNGTFLEKMLRAFQPSWGEVEGGFRLSGQNCPDFEHYLTEIRNRDVLSGLGQMLVVCGEIVRIGSSNEDKELLEILDRKSSALGNEGGLQHNLPAYLINKEEKSPSGKNTRNRASLEHASVAIADLCRSIRRSFADAQSDSAGAGWDSQHEKELLKSLSEAEVFVKDLSLSDKLRKRWQTFYEKVEADLDKTSPIKPGPSSSDIV